MAAEESRRRGWPLVRWRGGGGGGWRRGRVAVIPGTAHTMCSSPALAGAGSPHLLHSAFCILHSSSGCALVGGETGAALERVGRIVVEDIISRRLPSGERRSAQGQSMRSPAASPRGCWFLARGGPFLLCARRFGACQDELDATVGWKERWIRWDLRLSGRHLAFGTSAGTRGTITPRHTYHSWMIAQEVLLDMDVSALYPTYVGSAGYLCCRRVVLPGTTTYRRYLLLPRRSMMARNWRVPSTISLHGSMVEAT